jgi:hypothetical protein
MFVDNFIEDDLTHIAKIDYFCGLDKTTQSWGINYGRNIITSKQNRYEFRSKVSTATVLFEITNCAN